MQNELSEIEAIEQSMTNAEQNGNPHMIATSFLRQTQERIAELMTKAAKAEHDTNMDHMKDIKDQIAKLEVHLGILEEANKKLRPDEVPEWI